MVKRGTNNRAKVIVSARNNERNRGGTNRPIGRLGFQPRQRDESLLLSSRARALLIAPLTPTCVAILIVSRVRIYRARPTRSRLPEPQPPIFPPSNCTDIERFSLFRDDIGERYASSRRIREIIIYARVFLSF